MLHVCGEVYAFYDLVGTRQSIQPSRSKAIYLSLCLAWPLFVESRLPLKVYFEGKSRVLFGAQVDVPFPPHQCHVKVLGWEPPQVFLANTEGFEKYVLAVGLVLTRTAASAWSILNPCKSKMGPSFSLCIHRIRKCQFWLLWGQMIHCPQSRLLVTEVAVLWLVIIYIVFIFQLKGQGDRKKGSLIYSSCGQLEI